MKLTVGLFMLILLSSCFNADTRKIEQLNQRIITLEQRIDSLSHAGDFTQPVGLYDTYNTNKNNTNANPAKSASTRIVKQSNRCQAITKRGTQCKRTAKNGSYCWQHGG